MVRSKGVVVMWQVPILSEIVGLGKEWIKGKQEIKAAKTKAEAQVIVNSAQNLADWEKIQAKASESSWKDEYLVVLLTLPIPLCMFPDLAVHIQKGFEVLGTLPDWYQWSLLAGISASFGLKFTHKLRK